VCARFPNITSRTPSSVKVAELGPSAPSLIGKSLWSALAARIEHCLAKLVIFDVLTFLACKFGMDSQGKKKLSRCVPRRQITGRAGAKAS
jgi:hypothetical protein